MPRIRCDPPDQATLSPKPGLLWYGDNLDVLREHISDASVDLVYLDPPFQSGKDYNVIFEAHRKDAARAQAEAFKDTWRWGHEAEASYLDVERAGGRPTLNRNSARLGTCSKVVERT